MTNEQTLEVVIQHVRAAVAEAQDDDGVVTIKAEMLSLLLEELAPGGSQTQPNIAAAESGTGAASSVEPGAPRCPRCNGPEGWHSMTCGRRLSIVAAEIRNDASAAILQNYAVPAQASEDWRLVHDWGPDCEYRWIRTCKCSRCAQNREGSQK